MSMSLYTITAKYQQAFYALADSDLPDDCIDDTLEGMEGELVEKGQNVLAYALNLEAEAKALKEIEANVARRRKSKESQADHMRKYLMENMAKSGITEIRALDNSFIAKLLIGRDESVVIDDESQLPMDYKREIPASYQADKMLVKKAIKDGYDVPGAHIEKRDRLEIR